MPPDAPRFQGIFYRHCAIGQIDGKDRLCRRSSGSIRSSAISKYSVTLVGPGKQQIQIGMGQIMRAVPKNTSRSPGAARVAPFVIFVLLTALQGKFGAASACWFYLAKTLVGPG